jgi:hypothetical protein
MVDPAETADLRIADPRIRAVDRVPAAATVAADTPPAIREVGELFKEARELFRDFSRVQISIRPGTGDLLPGEAGSPRGGSMMKVLRLVWPRWAAKTVLHPLGLAMMIEAQK